MPYSSKQYFTIGHEAIEEDEESQEGKVPNKYEREEHTQRGIKTKKMIDPVWTRKWMCL